MKFLRILKIWFYSRKQIMDEVQSLTEMLDIQMSKYIDKIEALDQDKLYVLDVGKDVFQDEATILRRTLDEYKNRLKWTMPEILITNTPIREMTKQELKLLRG